MSALQSWPGAICLAKDPFPVAIHVSLAAAFILAKILFLLITGEIIFSVVQCLKSCKTVLAQILGEEKRHKSHHPLIHGNFFPEIQKIWKLLSKQEKSFIRTNDNTISLQAGGVLFLGTLFWA